MRKCPDVRNKQKDTDQLSLRLPVGLLHRYLRAEEILIRTSLNLFCNFGLIRNALFAFVFHWVHVRDSMTVLPPVSNDMVISLMYLSKFTLDTWGFDRQKHSPWE